MRFLYWVGLYFLIGLVFTTIVCKFERTESKRSNDYWAGTFGGFMLLGILWPIMIIIVPIEQISRIVTFDQFRNWLRNDKDSRKIEA